MTDPADRWQRIEQLFADALALPAASRAAFLERHCADDAGLRAEIEALLRAHDATGILDGDPARAESAVPPVSLASGTVIGNWRIDGPIGRGGMGEVYRVTRDDAGFTQPGALKLLRHEAAGQLERFHNERRILARLEHPGIARLLDGGTTTDGRPYTVMEFVEGTTLVSFCRDRNSSLADRVALFLQVCEAVAFAHRNLVIHRDLKPDNILVDASGHVKLLDFGIAKLLDVSTAAAAGDHTVAPFTPDYAAPEQLSGEAVTTATDIYALGVVLFELLTEERPLSARGLPSTQALRLVLDRDAPPPSRVARGRTATPIPARLLQGDIDAIVGKCLRKEAAHRYETVNALNLDLQRHRRGEPVLAREGARLYVLGRMLHRYRWAVAATTALVLALAAGLAGTLWQSQRAQRAAERATATKDFLLGLFRANDPRFASDKPKGEITAKELLDIGSERIEKEFAGQPELQIELLGMTADIYDNLADDERYAALQKRRVELAEQHYGKDDPIVLDALISEAEALTYRDDFERSAQLLEDVDRRLNASAHNASVLRARWWLVRWEFLHSSGAAQPQLDEAVGQAIALYARFAPDTNDHAFVLGLKAIDYARAEDPDSARRYFDEARAVFESAPDRSDIDLLTLLNNAAQNLENLGDFDGARATYLRAEDLARRTSGERSPSFWLVRAYHARLLHRHGDRARADELFREMIASIPADWSITTEDAWARGEYADCLAADGRAVEAIPILEETLRRYESGRSNSIPVWRLDLGDAYDRAGRVGEARTALEKALEELTASNNANAAKQLRFRERWARFLLDHSEPGDADFERAAGLFDTLAAATDAKPSVGMALVLSGQARVASARGDHASARRLGEQALSVLSQVRALHDVRVEVQLWLAQGRILLAAGDASDAVAWVERALAASQHDDAPSSSSIADAEQVLRAARAATSQ